MGTWKNYDDLEESLTLEELTETYGKILKNRSEDMEFKARLAGAKIKPSGDKQPEESQSSKPTKQSGLVDRLKQNKQAEMHTTAKSGKQTTFSDGVGYMVI